MSRIKNTLKEEANNIQAFPTQQSKNKLNLSNIKPITKRQHDAFVAYEASKNLLMTGSSGTGKTFVAMYLALREILSDFSPYKKLIIVRSTVPTRDIGALPGDISEKVGVYELPYHLICADLFNNDNAYDELKSKSIISFVTTAFIRGVTFSDCIVIVDEYQNMHFEEIFSVITRIGKNCKIILSGDSLQTDYLKGQKSGFKEITRVLNQMSSFEPIRFNVDDVVRSGLVKEFLILYDSMCGEDDV